MQEDLVRGYRNFMLCAIKVYFLGRNIIQDEIDFFTNKRLKDGLIFFLCVFEQIDPKLFKNLSFQDEKVFNEYLSLSKNKIVLSAEGQALKKYLEEKLALHATMLEFNGIKPQYIGKITTILKRFEKFWQMIITFSRKNTNNLQKIDWMDQNLNEIFSESCIKDKEIAHKKKNNKK